MNPWLKLDSKPLPTILSTEHGLLKDKQQCHKSLTAISMRDADWASCTCTQHPSQAHSLNWRVLRWLTKLNCRILLPHCLWNLIFWPHTTLQKCYSIFASSCETSMFLKKPLADSTKTMMHVRQWQTCRNSQHVLDTWISATMSSVNGSNNT